MSPVYLNGQEVVARRGRTLFDYADALRVRLPTSCGRNGSCHECIVEVRRGMAALNLPTAAEAFLRGDFRLACQAAVSDPDGGAVVEFAARRQQLRILTEGRAGRRARWRQVPLDSGVERRGDGVFVDGRPAGPYGGRLLGLAVDVGTTTVALNLADLETGEVIGASSFENPQRFGGSDIMHRISYDGGAHRGELRQALLAGLNFEIGELARQCDIRRRQIYAAALVGNTTMRDLLFGLDVQPVGVKPYRSITETEYAAGIRSGTALNVGADQLGLRIHPQAAAYGGPLLGGHIGADLAAGLLAIGMDEQEAPVMLVDVGTNTEVVIGNRHGMVAASCPAGPAFEGGLITYGMPGYDGAVDSVRLAPGGPAAAGNGGGPAAQFPGDATEFRPVTATIGGGPAQGICGSGLVDLLAELRAKGLMNELGVLAGGARDYCFDPPSGMTLSRADISALAQAKSANYAGQFIALRQYGLPPAQLARLYLAGGFANYLDAANAVNIGFIAGFPAERIEKVGNPALDGATLLLLSRPMRRRSEELAQRVEQIELETTPDFFDIFVEGCMFKPMPPVP